MKKGLGETLGLFLCKNLVARKLSALPRGSSHAHTGHNSTTMKKIILANPYFSLLATAWHYARGERTRYAVIYSMFVVSNLISATKPIFWGVLINDIQRDGRAVLRHAWIYIGLYMLQHFGDWLFHGFARVMERELAFNLSRNFLQEMYHKTLRLPVKWHQDNHSGATINRVRKAYEALLNFFQDGFQIVHAIAKFGFSFVAMLYFSPLFGGIAVVLGIIAVYITLKFDKPLIMARNETNEKEHVVSATLFDSLSNIITVITLRLEQRMEKTLLARVGDVFPPFRRKIRINEWKWFAVDGIVAVIYCTILMGYIYQNHTPGQVFYMGGLVILVGFVERFTSVFHDVAWLYNQVVNQHTDVQTAKNITEAYDREHLAEGSKPLPPNWRKIVIQGLNFKHELEGLANNQTQKPGLYDLNIQIERGKRIALVGESGSGKSTLLALLRGLYPPQEGIQVQIDGRVAPERLNALSDEVTLFPQEPEIFENTISYNITLGLPFSEEDIRKVCETAHFSEVVAQLPAGLGSNIREKGVNLSGGQKQRLALARGVLAARDCGIVLLDEPTSSVDPKTESEIYEKMFAEFGDKAIVSSLHRLHLLHFFDHVYVMQNGRVVDEGSFAYLRQHSPVFQEMWRHQEQILTEV